MRSGHHQADHRPSAVLGLVASSQVAPVHSIFCGATMALSTETYDLLLSLADQAPIEALPLSERTLSCARTLGYLRIGQVRNTPPLRLLQDLGEERAEEVKQALYDFGMRQYGAAAA